MKLAVIVVAIGLAGSARADETQLSGFVTRGSGELTGRVTGDDGKPLPGVKVHIVSKAGDQTVTADKDGRYRVMLKGLDSFVYVDHTAHVSGQMAEGDGDVVEIHETIPPAVMPKPKPSYAIIPDYSDKAMDDDVWLRAWLVLDISDQGTVTRLKLVNAPGHELDAIAVSEGFKLKFEPARDRANQAIRALIVWSFEWPSYWWMLGNHYRIDRFPVQANGVACRKSGPPSDHYRDCSKPDLARAVVQPWTERPTQRR
jgi:hypothetical protein